jgi:hypothetical protein
MNGGSNGRARQRYASFRQRGFERLALRRNCRWIVVKDDRLHRLARQRFRRWTFRPGCGAVTRRIFIGDVVIPGIDGAGIRGDDAVRISRDYGVCIPRDNGICTPGDDAVDIARNNGDRIPGDNGDSGRLAFDDLL